MSDVTENTEAPSPQRSAFCAVACRMTANFYPLKLTESQKEVIESAAAELYRTAEAFSIENEVAELATRLARLLTDAEHQKVHSYLAGFTDLEHRLNRTLTAEECNRYGDLALQIAEAPPCEPLEEEIPF